ncbi:glycosyltransferase family 2 protein [Rudaeicoccus suwonensis]|uniref:Cellulose synthase/poly-beta-1,6-N-acetylglucosamine synthase-like glycosyltransferase n=1 Tax=Rudaeicoccus suwonensis TaxID=657409 RepID=A0A561E8Z3_9MICO|nr:glycosyltransferase family 2 protein [Rudaeicoccus suwonensis]TWE12098.1 cellulose synthase/poly-beta-1,6-N-acetylglucosamine synthase-like glycosyltransferase [Rudaeicoccus suwonensis]
MPAPETPSQHGVSVVMPILNEERHLAESVRGILAQEWSGPIEIILAVGPSTDRTDDVAAALQRNDARIRRVDNPTGRTPEALNRAIAEASYDIVCRVDGHGILSTDYLATAVRTLDETGAANVGGIMDAEGTTPFECAVAVAMKSKIGVGGVKFKQGGSAGEADTVYLGVFRREWLERVGGYDERFTRAQDWEMNFRIRAAGGVVWFTPEMRVAYRPRGSFSALSRQYREYGRWRRVVARRHKGSINARYLAPPTAVALVAAGAVGGLLWRPLWVIPLTYAGGVVLGGAFISAGEKPSVRLRVPAVLATMHMSWGFGFLASRIRLTEDVQ